MKNFKNITNLLSAMLLSQLVFSQTQTGPGGVGDASTIAVWLDASQLSLNDGDPVATWTDISGNGNSFTQGTGANRPTFVQASSLNGHPAVRFDGINDYMDIGGVSMLNNTDFSFYATTRTSENLTSATNFRTIVQSRYNNKSGNFFAIHYNRGSNTNRDLLSVISYSTSASNILRHTIGTTSTSLDIPITSSVIYSSNSDLHSYTANDLFLSNNPSFLPGNHQGFNIGYSINHSDRFINGDMNDLVVYNFDLNSAQDKIVRNYFSAKYNTNIGSDLIYSYRTSHNNDLAGIGRDNGANQHLSAKGTGVLEVTVVSLDDNDFLLWAHDNGAFSSQSSNIPVSYTITGGEVMTRSWRVTETGETGDLTFVFDMTGIHFGHPDDYQLLIDDNGDFTDGGTIQIDGVLVGDELTFTVLGAQLSDGDFFTIGNSFESFVVSIVDGQDWNEPSTWSCNCIPESTFYVSILNGHTVTLSDNQEVLNLNIQSTGILSINSSGVLDVYGDLTINGTINSDVEGTLNFIGASAQSITATGTQEIGGLTLNNANGLTLVSGIYNFNGIFTPTNGNMDFGNNDITFVSNASGTAVIGVLGAGASFSGMSNFKVQRFIPTGVAGFRDIGSPLTTMPLRQWDDEIFISGSGFPDGCALTATGCYHSATYWRSDLQAYRTVNDIDSNIMNGSAIEIYLGDNLNSFAGRALTATGTPNTSLSVNIPVQNGWNLISNPFLSPIDFDNVTRNSVGTGNYFYVYDPSISGFQWWDGSSQTSSVAHLDGGILASSQGFWINHSGAASTLTINQGSKSVNAADQYLRSNGTFLSQNNLYFELSSPSGNQKAIGSVKMYDAWKSNDVSNLPLLSPPNIETVSIYTADENGNEYVVNNVNKEEDCFSMPVFVDVLRTGEYSIEFKNPGTEFEIYVKNNLTGESTRLTQDMSFDFRIDGSIKKVNPYNLEFKKVNPCIVVGIANEVFEVFASFDNILISSVEPIKQDVTINVINTLGAKVIQNVRMNKEATNISINTNGLSGLYLVSISDLNGNVVKVEKVFLNK